jgi:hypothetical protein
MTAYFLIQFLLLQANWLVSVVPAPRVDAPHRATEAVGGGLAFDDPKTSSRASPKMGEPEEVKGPRTLIRPTTIHCRHRRFTERDKPRLIGVDCQTVLAESLRQNFHHALGVSQVAKPYHKSSSPGEFRPQALTEPDVSLSAHPALIAQSQDEVRSATARTSSVLGGQQRPTSEPHFEHDERNA